MQIKLERIYDKPQDLSGYRILVDRLWPRGISKVNAKLDEWEKKVARPKSCANGFHTIPKSFPSSKPSILRNWMPIQRRRILPR